MTTAIAPVAPEVWRTCARCHTPKDAKLFAPNGVVCRDCSSGKLSPTVQARRVERAVNEVLDRLTNRHTSAPSLDAMVTGLIAEFGGLEGVIRKIVQDHEDCRSAEKPNRKVIQDFNLTFLRLIRDLQSMRGSSPLQGISEADLNAILFTAFAERVEDMSIEQLAAAASLKGYKLVPADDTVPEALPGG